MEVNEPTSMTQKTLRPQIDDFSNYRTGFSYSSGRVVLSNDDSLSFEEIRSAERSVKLTCVIHATKIKNLDKAPERRKIDETIIANSPIDIRFPYNWFNSFNENRLKELFERYYVHGYDCFCLAIMPENTDGLPLYKFTLPDHLVYYDPQHDSRINANFGVDHYFEKLIKEIREYGNNCLSKDKFIGFIQRIRSVAERVHLNNPLRNTDCLELNNIFKDLLDDKTISTDILTMMFNSMAEDFIKNKLISKCQLCGDYFIFKHNKKFCSPLTENKDCGKQARNKKYYSEKGHKNLPKYRQATKDLRAFYKQKGIKK